MSRKGVYPYDWMDSFDKFEQSFLPRREVFFYRLYGEDISESDYEFAWEIWKELKIKKMGDYHDLYLKTDVMLLTDLFEQFMETGNDMNYQVLQNLPTPTANSHAAPKQYVGTQVKAGRTMTGDINMNANKITNLAYPVHKAVRGHFRNFFHPEFCDGIDSFRSNSFRIERGSNSFKQKTQAFHREKCQEILLHVRWSRRTNDL